MVARMVGTSVLTIFTFDSLTSSGRYIITSIKSASGSWVWVGTCILPAVGTSYLPRFYNTYLGRYLGWYRGQPHLPRFWRVIPTLTKKVNDYWLLVCIKEAVLRSTKLRRNEAWKWFYQVDHVDRFGTSRRFWDHDMVDHAFQIAITIRPHAKSK